MFCRFYRSTPIRVTNHICPSLSLADISTRRLESPFFVEILLNGKLYEAVGSDNNPIKTSNNSLIIIFASFYFYISLMQFKKNNYFK